MDRLVDMKQTLENDVINVTHNNNTAQDEESKWQALERKIKYERLNDAELGAIWDALIEVVGTQQSGVTLAVLYGSLVSVLQQQVATLSSNVDQDAASSSSDEEEDEDLEDEYDMPRPRRDRRSKAQRRAHKFTHQDLQANKSQRGAEQRIQYENEMRRVEAGFKLLYIICMQLTAATLRQSTVFEHSVALCMALIDKRAVHGVYQHVLKNLIRIARAQSTSTWSQNTMAQLIRLLVSRALEDDQSMRNKISKTLQSWLEAPLEAQHVSVEQWRESVSKPLVSHLVHLSAQHQRATLVRVSEVIGAVLPLVSESGVKKLSDVLLKFTQRADPELSVSAFDQLHAYCAQLTQPQPLVVQFINALYELQPNKNDIELSLHYVQVLGSAYQALCITDRELWTNKLPRLLATTLAYLQTDTFDLHRVATLSLQNVIHQGCATMKQQAREEIEQWLCGESFTGALDKMVQSLHTSLKVIYQHAWSKIIALLHTLTRGLAELMHLAFTAEKALAAQQEGYFYLLRDLCAQVINLHSLHAKETAQDDDHVTMALSRDQQLGRAQRMSRREQDELDEEIEQLLTPLISLLGIARYLTAIQFALPPTHTPRHCWLLPILRRRVAGGASLMYYHNVFVKQTALLYTAALAAQPAQQQTLLQLYKQSWALLPSFALESRDVVEAFPQLSAVLLDTLGEKQVRRVDIRPAVVQCLTILAHRAHREQTRDASSTEMTRVLAPQSAQVLSTLFNSFVADTTSQATSALRNQIIQGIAAWLQIADQPLVLQIFKSVMTKFLTATAKSADSQVDQAEVQSLVELLIPFIAYLQGDADLSVVYKSIEPLMHSKHHGIEKKAFKALMTLCEHHGSWVSSQLWTVHRALIGTLESSTASSKAMRLRTVLHVITHLNTTQLALEFLLNNNPDKSVAKLGNLMPEVTLALKETSVKVRSAAEKIFDVMFVKMIELHDSNTTITHTSSHHVALFMKHLIALLAARHAMMISAALSAFRILFKYIINLYKQRKRVADSEFVLFLDESADSMSDGTTANPFAQQITAVPKMVISVLESPYKEVVASALEVIKTLSTKSIADTTLLRPHLEYLIKTIFTGMTADNRDHFRMKIKIILERLIAKFGYETIEPFVPRKHRKLIVNIRKTLGRLDKKKKQKQEEYQKRVKDQRAAAQDAAMMDSSEDHVPPRSVDQPEDEDIAKKLLKSESSVSAQNKRASQYETQLKETLERRRRYKELQASSATSATSGEKSMWILEGRTTAHHPAAKNRAHTTEEDDDEEMLGDDERVIDFLDPNANQYIVSTNPHKFTGRREKQTDFETTEDGRMIIKEEDDEEDEEDTKKKNGNKKRKRSDEDEDEEEPINNGHNNGKMRKGPAVKKQKLNAAGQVGEMYASKYAAGDMKKPGRPDPYAYIKLDPKFLNKRRRHVAHQQFENIVKGAKKGAKTKPKRR